MMRMTDNKNSLMRMTDNQLSRRGKNHNLNGPQHGECICLNATMTCHSRRYSNHKKRVLQGRTKRQSYSTVT